MTPSTAESAPQTPLSMRRIFQTWWPLALGWLMMTIEIPILTAVIARVAEPEINLAAWGVTFTLSLILGSPAIMLLATSTTLTKDWASYLTLRRYVVVILVLLTGLHLLLVFSPLFDLVVIRLIAVPEEIIEPVRLGLTIMLPYIAALGYRRFNNGVLIRFGHSRAVTVGVIVRLVTDIIVLTLFYLLTQASGVVIATTTFATGVFAEFVYSNLRVRPVLRDQLRQAPPVAEPVTLPLYLKFYIPLVLTGIMHMVVQPIVSAALSRMPNPLDSLAVWPVVFSLLILFTSAGMSYTEVVVVLLDEPQALTKLRRFTMGMAGATIALLLIMTATPLAELWFRYVAALPLDLITLAKVGLWFLLPIPGYRVLQSWYQGILMNNKRTYGITESVAVFLISNATLLWAGVVWGVATGLYMGLGAMVLSETLRTARLWQRARPSLHAVRAREQHLPLAA